MYHYASSYPQGHLCTNNINGYQDTKIENIHIAQYMMLSYRVQATVRVAKLFTSKKKAALRIDKYVRLLCIERTTQIGQYIGLPVWLNVKTIGIVTSAVLLSLTIQQQTHSCKTSDTVNNLRKRSLCQMQFH